MNESSAPLVPVGFEIPEPPQHSRFRFEPLGAEHNERDHAAWMGSIDHIKATPGFVGRDWPEPMSLEANLGDLVKHADNFAARTDFTWSILAPDSDQVIGCLYIYPARTDGFDALVTSWVIGDVADLDRVVWQTVSDWVAASWPFTKPEYVSRA